MDRPAPVPEGLRIELVLGEQIPTDARMAVDLSTGRYQVVARRPGDGRVLRESALGVSGAAVQSVEIGRAEVDAAPGTSREALVEAVEAAGFDVVG